MDSLRGHLLLAGAGLYDPNFRRTVILIGEHGDEGAMGVVLNRPSPIPVDEAVPPLAGLPALAGGDGLVYVGGPVQPDAIVVIADFEEPERAGVLILGTIGFVPGGFVPDGFVPGDVEADSIGGLRQARVYAGYAGWGAGQLESELDESSWIVEPALPGDIFTDEPGTLWSAILRRKGGPYALLAQMPDDPRLN